MLRHGQIKAHCITLYRQMCSWHDMKCHAAQRSQAEPEEKQAPVSVAQRSPLEDSLCPASLQRCAGAHVCPFIAGNPERKPDGTHAARVGLPAFVEVLQC